MCNNTTTIRDKIHLSLDEFARQGAQRMLALALQAEADEYIRRYKGERDENGHALVVRNGRSQERTIQCGAGELKIQAPRVNDMRPDHQFTSSILPPYMRKSPRLEEAGLFSISVASPPATSAQPYLLF